MNVEQLPDVLAGSIVLTGLYVLIGLSWVIIIRPHSRGWLTHSVISAMTLSVGVPPWT